MEHNNTLVSQLIDRAHAGVNGNADAPAERALLGQVTAADTERGVTVHLRPEQPVELLRQGQFVVVEGRHVRFFGTINSFRLATTDPMVGMDPPDFGSALVRDTLSRSATYVECNVRSALELSEE